MATVKICDFCKKEIGSSVYHIHITKAPTAIETYDGTSYVLVDKETCQRCFLWIEREINRLKTIKEMN